MINEDILRILDTNGKLLYLLLEEGSQRFEEIVETLNPFEKMKKNKLNPNSKLTKSQTQTVPHTNPKVFMSRGTISKRLKYLKDPNRKYIEQISELDVTTNRTILKYQITATGKAFLTQLIRTEQVSVRPDQFEPIYSHITEFFQRIGVDQDLYLPQLIKMIARIDPAKLFQLPQTDELFYTLFYIFQNMLESSLNEPQFRYLELKNFCETYGLSEVQVQYHLEKILGADLGFFRVNWESDLFFQQDDLIGAVIFSLIHNALETEIVKKSLKLAYVNSFNLLTREIVDKLIQLQLIRERIRNAFQEFIEILIVKVAIDRGFSRIDIAEYWPALNRLLLTPEGIELSKRIFGLTTSFERLKAIDHAYRILLIRNS